MPKYSVVVETWENDADHYKTKTIKGLTKEDVAFYVELCCCFKSANNSAKGLGNYGHPLEQIEEVVHKVVKSNLLLSDRLVEVWSCKGKALHSTLVRKLLGRTVEYKDEENFCRVVESVKVYEDCTYAFKNAGVV